MMKRAKPRSIRFHILVGVNGTLAVLLAALLAYEYRRELTDRIAEKHSALQEEATLIAEGVERLRHHGTSAIQGYLDAVCSRMHRSTSPAHHIVVRFDGTTLQAERRASDEILKAMSAAAEAKDHTASFRDDELVVGSEFHGDISVLVAESARTARKAVVIEILWHLVVIALASLAAAGIVNYLLLHAIDRPLRRLVTTVEQIGHGQFGIRTGDFNTVELTALAAAVNGMSDALADAEAQRREQMRKAREIQSHLLPKHPQLPGVRLEQLYRPADEVSGDYYDIFTLHDRSTLVCVADVVGHGVPAAMTAAMLKVLLSEVTRHKVNPAEILGWLNERFAQVTLPSDFASVFLVRWKADEAFLEYASAGHGTSWFSPKDGPCRPLKSTGLLLGVDHSATWQTNSLAVAVGDRLLLATDGLTETWNAQRELFGQRRVISLLELHSALAPEEMTDLIDRSVTTFRGHTRQMDDLTLVLLEFTVAARAMRVRPNRLPCEAG